MVDLNTFFIHVYLCLAAIGKPLVEPMKKKFFDFSKFYYYGQENKWFFKWFSNGRKTLL